MEYQVLHSHGPEGNGSDEDPAWSVDVIQHGNADSVEDLTCESVGIRCMDRVVPLPDGSIYINIYLVQVRNEDGTWKTVRQL